MLVMALKSDAERVYAIAQRYFTPEEVGEAFACAVGMAIPTELQRYMKEDGRDLIGDVQAARPRLPGRLDPALERPAHRPHGGRARVPGVRGGRRDPGAGIRAPMSRSAGEASGEHRPLLHRPVLRAGGGTRAPGGVRAADDRGGLAGRTGSRPPRRSRRSGASIRASTTPPSPSTTAPSRALAKVLNFLGGGTFNIPFRVVALILLLVLRRFRHAIAFALTWVLAEGLMTATKSYLDRMRPPNPLVDHARLLLPLRTRRGGRGHRDLPRDRVHPRGRRRRKWEWVAVVFAFAMGMSRVYLNAHWFSDAPAGCCWAPGWRSRWPAVVALADRRIMGHTPHDEVQDGEEPAAAADRR